MSTDKVYDNMITVHIKLVGSCLAPRLRILEISQVIGALSPTTTTRWPTTVGIHSAFA